MEILGLTVSTQGWGPGSEKAENQGPSKARVTPEVTSQESAYDFVPNGHHSYFL